ncbi:hypothetical protein M885DRAFT_619709 [Pelagophyceae sp. CCMP2097]|nr:hypothetical protein M885DRAFT_619709 [Pelagophyceae sp. CCMP2097]
MRPAYCCSRRLADVPISDDWFPALDCWPQEVRKPPSKLQLEASLTDLLNALLSRRPAAPRSNWRSLRRRVHDASPALHDFLDARCDMASRCVQQTWRLAASAVMSSFGGGGVSGGGGVLVAHDGAGGAVASAALSDEAAGAADAAALPDSKGGATDAAALPDSDCGAADANALPDSEGSAASLWVLALFVVVAVAVYVVGPTALQTAAASAPGTSSVTTGRRQPPGRSRFPPVRWPAGTSPLEVLAGIRITPLDVALTAAALFLPGGLWLGQIRRLKAAAPAVAPVVQHFVASILARPLVQRLLRTAVPVFVAFLSRRPGPLSRLGSAAGTSFGPPLGLPSLIRRGARYKVLALLQRTVKVPAVNALLMAAMLFLPP